MSLKPNRFFILARSFLASPSIVLCFQRSTAYRALELPSIEYNHIYRPLTSPSIPVIFYTLTKAALQRTRESVGNLESPARKRLVSLSCFSNLFLLANDCFEVRSSHPLCYQPLEVHPNLPKHLCLLLYQSNTLCPDLAIPINATQVPL